MLILVRHGESVANAQGLLLGRTDAALTDLGRAQAAAVPALLSQPVVEIRTSPLARARDTAGLLGLAAPVAVDERWVEVDYGEYDGMPLRDVPAELWARWRADPAFCPPGGESLAAVGARVGAACAELAATAALADVVVVSHVSPIKAAVAWALGVGDEVAWRMHLEVAAVCRVTMGPAGPSLRAFNDTAHLRTLAPAPEQPETASPPEPVPGEDPSADGGDVYRRAEALRKRWADVVGAVAAGRLALADAVALGRDDPEVGALKVVKVVEAVPGVGKVRARRALEAAGVGERTPVGALPPGAVEAVTAAFASVPGPGTAARPRPMTAADAP